MKRSLFTSALLAALTIPCLAGTDMAPSHDGKDMKDMKQMTQATESDAGFYVAAYGGAQFDTNYGDNRQTDTNAGGGTETTNAKINSRWGGVGGVKFGYNFQSFDPGFLGLRLQPAVEAEALYIGDSSHSSHTFAAADYGSFSSNSGDFFVNGILRFKNKSIVTPYIGIGVGLQYVTTHGTLYSPGGTIAASGLDTDDLDFAVQGLAGFDVAVCQHISLFTEYKFIDAIGTDGDASAPSGSTYRFKPDEIQQHLITAGVKYTF
jgi:opacity protein-like surface antigen